MGIFNETYQFIYNWLFGAGSTIVSLQSQELATVLLTVCVCLFVLYIAILPIKAIISMIFRGW